MIMTFDELHKKFVDETIQFHEMKEYVSAIKKVFQKFENDELLVEDAYDEITLKEIMISSEE